MTDAERFEKALRTMFAVPPDQVEQINQQVKADYSAFGRREVREDREAARRSRKSDGGRSAPRSER